MQPTTNNKEAVIGILATYSKTGLAMYQGVVFKNPDQLIESTGNLFTMTGESLADFRFYLLGRLVNASTS